MSERTRYTPAQLGQYFDRIGLPEHLRVYNIAGASSTQQYELLEQLLRHQLSSIPFENLTLHYSWHRVIHIDPQHVFDKIVRQPSRDARPLGRGGYCMENNTLFHTVLLSLGYDVYLVGSRCYENGRYTGFSHCLNVVTVAPGERYAVDVGFGPNEPVRPLRMEPGLVQLHISPASVRLRFDQISTGVKRRGENRMWIYEFRRHDADEWTPNYCFTELEFLPEDLAVMNYWPQKDPRSIFTQRLLCVRFPLDTETIMVPDDSGFKGQPDATPKPEINGVLILDGTGLKWRRNGDKVFEIQFGSEAERLAALERYFGITLSQGDKEAIRGTKLAIPENTGVQPTQL